MAWPILNRRRLLDVSSDLSKPRKFHKRSDGDCGGRLPTVYIHMA